MDKPKPGDGSEPPLNIENINDEHKYTTKEAGEILHLKWRTIVQHIRRGRITAETVLERRGPVYLISGSEIKRYQRERLPPPTKKER